MKSCKIILLGALLLFWGPIDLWSQSTSIYRPTADSMPFLAQNVKAVQQRLQRDLGAMPKKNKKRVSEEYKRRAEDLVKELNRLEYLSDAGWVNYFNGILAEIYRHNPEMSTPDIRLLLGRYESANATNIGEGTIVFHLGLLPFLDNESEVAAILCHELAHYQANHSNNFIQEYYDFLYSEETQDKLAEISKTGYDKSARALEIMKGMMYDNHRHGRYKESEADSLGLIYLKKTRYNPRSCITALQKLDKLDSIVWPVIPYKTLFDAPQFPFKDTWLAAPKTSILAAAPKEIEEEGEEEWNVDSLKTHPDCTNRILALQRQLGTEPTTGVLYLSSEEQFKTLQQNTPYELIEGLMITGEYGRSLFRSLVLLTEKPDDIYLKSIVGISLYHLHHLQKNHQLRDVLPLPNAEFTPEYNRFLQFFNNLRLNDFGKMGYFYCTNNLESHKAEEYPALALALSQKMMGQEAEFQQQKDRFINTFPKSKFIAWLNTLK